MYIISSYIFLLTTYSNEWRLIVQISCLLCLCFSFVCNFQPEDKLRIVFSGDLQYKRYVGWNDHVHWQNTNSFTLVSIIFLIRILISHNILVYYSIIYIIINLFNNIMTYLVVSCHSCFQSLQWCFLFSIYNFVYYNCIVCWVEW